LNEQRPALASGTSLGPYEITGALGAGGMGEVYRARDTRLDRTVAIKVLPEHVTENPQARARFEREAKVISSLNHPNICTLFDVGQHEGTHFLVMEFLDGETLSNRLAREGLSVEETLRLGAQIADALDAAHQQGLVHRDLKPDNIMLTKTGAKLLDFGLAKSATELAGSSSLTATPTATSPLTQQGTVLGTIGYMSPEQLEGREADARTDIFALGAVLYEMVTGRRAFDGVTQASVIASILKDDPRSMVTLQPVTPPALERLVRTCLAKDPEARWQSAGDLKRQLQWFLEEGRTSTGSFDSASVRDSTGGGGIGRRVLLGASAAGWLIAITALGLYFLGPPRGTMPSTAPLIRAEVPARTHSPTWEFIFGGAVTVSPDGIRFVQVISEQGRRRLWVHDLDGSESRVLEGTAGASYPFWSPDGRYIGFFAEDQLKKIPADGGVAQTLCGVAAGRGGTWSSQGVILFAQNVYGPLYTVPDGGGTPEPLTTTATDDVSHRFPYFLPDGNHFVFFGGRLSDTREIQIASLEDPRPRTLRKSRTAGRVASGHLLFADDGTIFAQPIEPQRLELTGGPVPLVDGVMTHTDMGIANFSVSENGILAHYAAYSREQAYQWLDAEGSVLGPLGRPGFFSGLDLSPDGGQLLTTIENPDTDEIELWIVEVATGRMSRTSVDDASSATWAPDGNRFAAVAGSDVVIVESSRGVVETVLRPEKPTIVADWSPDGRSLILMQQDTESGAPDAMSLDLSGDGEIRPLVKTPDWDWPAVLSPDGRLLAFVSDRRDPGSSNLELFVTELDGEGTWQISTDGAPASVGRQLTEWGPNGELLYYVNRAGTLMRVDIESSNGFRAGTPQPVSASLGEVSFVNLAPDGRLLVLRPSADQAIPPIHFLMNWTRLLDD